MTVAGLPLYNAELSQWWAAVWVSSLWGSARCTRVVAPPVGHMPGVGGCCAAVPLLDHPHPRSELCRALLFSYHSGTNHPEIHENEACSTARQGIALKPTGALPLAPGLSCGQEPPTRCLAW